MRVFWERLGVLGPIYRLAGHGLSDSDIAGRLNLTEATVRGCIGWILRFLQFKERNDLIWYSSGASPTFGSLDPLASHIRSSRDRIQEVALPIPGVCSPELQEKSLKSSGQKAPLEKV